MKALVGAPLDPTVCMGLVGAMVAELLDITAELAEHHGFNQWSATTDLAEGHDAIVCWKRRTHLNRAVEEAIAMESSIM